MDSLIAALRVGSGGRVIGVDFSRPMLKRAQGAAAALGVSTVHFHQADAERLPLGDASVDVALVNGILNLNPARTAILVELARVVRPGGSIYAAEMILREPLPPEEASNLTNWFA